MANFMDTGNGYPSTATPFAMDLATPIMAITQQMVKRRKEEIASDISQANENEARVLKALDFETVKGLSDKIQDDHIKALDELDSKWSGELAKYRGKLPPTSIRDLERDKRNMVTDVANKKANVMAFLKLQEDLANPKAAEYMDVQGTADAMAKWVKDGRIGESTFGLMKLRQWNGAELFERDLGKGLKNILDNRDETVVVNGKVITTTKFTPEQIKADVFNQIDTMPYNEKQKEEARQYAITQLPKNVVESVKYPPQPRSSGGKKEDVKKSILSNDVLERIGLHDENAIQSLKGKVFQDAYFDDNYVNPETGKIESVAVIKKFDGGTVRIPVGSNKMDFKFAFNEQLPTFLKLKASEIEEKVEPLTEPKVAIPYQIVEFEKIVSDQSKKYPNPDLPKADQSKPENLITANEKTRRELKDILPENWTVEERGFTWTKGLNKRDIVVKNESGEVVGEFDLKKPEGIKKMKDFARENSIPGQNYNERVGKKNIDLNTDAELQKAVSDLRAANPEQTKNLTDQQLAKKIVDSQNK